MRDLFGYVRPAVGELKVKDNEFYRAVYCGLCRAMGNCTGCLSQFTLNYDFVFLCTVLLAANDEPFEVVRGRCLAHPVKKRAYVKKNETLSRVASLSALLVYYKAKDDVADERGVKKLASALLLPALSRAKKKAKNPESLERTVKEKLDALSSLEKENTPSPDPPASIFGELLAEIARAGVWREDETARRVMYKVGYHLGRWIYAVDALCDMERDGARGAYNPYLLSFGGKPEKDELTLIEHSLILELTELEHAMALLDTNGRELIADVIENVLFAGLPAATKKAIYNGEETT